MTDKLCECANWPGKLPDNLDEMIKNGTKIGKHHPDCPKGKEPVKIIKVTNEFGDYYVEELDVYWIPNKINNIMPMIEGLLEDGDVGKSLKIEISAMTRNELDTLPEFEGW